MDLSFAAYEHCELCPRRCGVNRTAGERGVCGETDRLKVARAALHFWEEPPISGEAGSGTIFFSGCPLRCSFCQNDEISHDGVGIEVSVRRLAAQMIELQDLGALNVNLVTATHMAPHAVAAARIARERGLTVPVVYNTSGYEREEVIDALADVVDVWLTDLKYDDARLAATLSGAADYPDVATRALGRMHAAVRERGGRVVDADGVMRSGVICRLLVLPGEVEDACGVLERVAGIDTDQIDLSVMNQYTPNARMRAQGGPLAGALDELDYDIVLCRAQDLGFTHLWWQQEGTVSESFVPPFDATGVEGPEL